MRLFTLLAAFTLALQPAMADAARVTPMVLTLNEAGSGATGRIEVANTSDEAIPFEVLMFRGEISELGELELIPADEEFLVFPPQTTIGPRRQQVFRIQYIGTEPLDKSEVFYASMREVPVDREESTSNFRVQIVGTFNVLVNVVPAGAEPNVSHEILGVSERNGNPGILVRVANTGTRFVAAGRSDWVIRGTTVSGESYEQSYRQAEMGGIIGYGVVPAGGARQFFIPTPELLEPDGVSVELNI